MGPFCRAKTGSTAEPTRDFAALASAVRRGIGRPRGFLRWMHERMPFAASQASFFFDRYAVLVLSMNPINGDHLPEQGTKIDPEMAR